MKRNIEGRKSAGSKIKLNLNESQSGGPKRNWFGGSRVRSRASLPTLGGEPKAQGVRLVMRVGWQTPVPVFMFAHGDYSKLPVGHDT